MLNVPWFDTEPEFDVDCDALIDTSLSLPTIVFDTIDCEPIAVIDIPGPPSSKPFFAELTSAAA